MKSWGKQKEGRMGHNGNALVQQQSYLRRGWGGRQSVDHSIFCVMVVLAAETQCLNTSALSLFRMKHISEARLHSLRWWFLLFF